MHLADGVVNFTAQVVAANVLGVASAGLALQRAQRSLRSGVLWTGTLAAFVLVAQAVNLPLFGGASSHVIGAGLLTLAVGPALAIAALSAVLLVQALLFGDGGLTVLGINLLNIAVLPALTMAVARRLFGASRAGLRAAAVLGTAAGHALGALGLSLILIHAAAAPPKLTLGWLVGLQSVSGLLEGLLTALAVDWLRGRAPALLVAQGTRQSLDHDARLAAPVRGGLGWALLVIAATALLLPLASSQPDALERVVSGLGR